MKIADIFPLADVNYPGWVESNNLKKSASKSKKLYFNKK